MNLVKATDQINKVMYAVTAFLHWRELVVFNLIALRLPREREQQ